MDKSLN
jgi:WD40 repeat protein